jgi:hypothetical protein
MVQSDQECLIATTSNCNSQKMWMINLNTGCNQHTSLLSYIHTHRQIKPAPTPPADRSRIHYPIVTPSLHSSARIAVQRPISHGVMVHGSDAHLIDEAAKAAGDGANEMVA